MVLFWMNKTGRVACFCFCVVFVGTSGTGDMTPSSAEQRNIRRKEDRRRRELGCGAHGIVAGVCRCCPSSAGLQALLRFLDSRQATRARRPAPTRVLGTW